MLAGRAAEDPQWQTGNLAIGLESWSVLTLYQTHNNYGIAFAKNGIAMKRFLSLWFRHLTTDYLAIGQPDLAGQAFVLVAPERGRMLIKAASAEAQAIGITTGMVVADARAVFPSLLVLDDEPGLADRLLYQHARWCLRYTPVAAVHAPDGLLLDISGCPHLWGGERPYLKELVLKLRSMGYNARAAIADTIGAAWAVARYGKVTPIIEPGQQLAALHSLPPAALRLEPAIPERMQKLGLYTIGSFIAMPRSVLRRRFGQPLLDRMDQATGQCREPVEPICPPLPYQERLPCPEPVRTATAIEIALKQLLTLLCKRLVKESLGLRSASLKCYRLDGNIQQIAIGTNRPSRSVHHLLRLFELKIASIEPALGIELFLLEAPVVEALPADQETLWNQSADDSSSIGELLDRFAMRIGAAAIHRYLPAEHHWPERSVREAGTLEEKPATAWRKDRMRPVSLLAKPEPIEVMVPLPDYPPLQFRYQGKLHKRVKADGPERIEQEWWLSEGEHRDYYAIEDEEGRRYWVFRSGHYRQADPEWFIHGFFA
jgi:protein ImuB